MIRDKCNVCKSRSSIELVNLGYQPNADTFLSKSDIYRSQQRYPLVVDACGSCGHMQNRYLVKPSERYSEIDYSYTSDHSSISINHFKELAKFAQDRAKIDSSSTVIEAGSNIGLLLKSIRELCSASVIGVDPSPNITSLAEANGIPSICSFFDPYTAASLPKADLIIGCNVLNHMDNPYDLFKSADLCLKTNGLIIIEVPCGRTLLQQCYFDTIYHEHVNYFTENSLREIASLNGYSVEFIKTIKYMGKSLRVGFRKAKSIVTEHLEVNKTSSPEWFEIPTQDQLRAFKLRTENFRFRLLEELLSIDDSMKGNSHVVFLGAATKANTLLNYLDPPSGLIKTVADVMPSKIGKYTPGTRIKISDEAEALPKATHVFITAWNLAEIIEPKVLQYNCKAIKLTP